MLAQNFKKWALRKDLVHQGLTGHGGENHIIIMWLVPQETAKPMALWEHRGRHLMQAGKWARNGEAGRAGQGRSLQEGT